MRNRSAALSLGATAMVVMGLLSLGLVALTAQAATAPWKVPRTADGKPDLSGSWSDGTFTPLERPAQFADKEFFTEAEAKDFFSKAVQTEAARELEGGIHYPTSDYGMDKWQNNVKMNLRTSLIFDPASGKQPARTPEAQKRMAAVRALREGEMRGRADGPEDRSLFERCMRGTQGPPLMTAAFDNEVQIVQTPQHIMLIAQSMYDVRIIPLDGRPHLPANVRLLLGDSRGRWEGDTLVVDTTNFSDQVNFLGATRSLHIVERFTRVSDELIRYRATVEDPATWTAPWSYELPLAPSGRLYEFACHEANLGLLGTLRGAREAEKAGAVATKQ